MWLCSYVYELVFVCMRVCSTRSSCRATGAPAAITASMLPAITYCGFYFFDRHLVLRLLCDPYRLCVRLLIAVSRERCLQLARCPVRRRRSHSRCLCKISSYSSSNRSSCINSYSNSNISNSNNYSNSNTNSNSNNYQQQQQQQQPQPSPVNECGQRLPVEPRRRTADVCIAILLDHITFCIIVLLFSVSTV